jgi:hypothetical protein
MGYGLQNNDQSLFFVSYYSAFMFHNEDLHQNIIEDLKGKKQLGDPEFDVTTIFKCILR